MLTLLPPPLRRLQNPPSGEPALTRQPSLPGDRHDRPHPSAYPIHPGISVLLGDLWWGQQLWLFLQQPERVQQLTECDLGLSPAGSSHHCLQILATRLSGAHILGQKTMHLVVKEFVGSPQKLTNAPKLTWQNSQHQESHAAKPDPPAACPLPQGPVRAQSQGLQGRFLLALQLPRGNWPLQESDCSQTLATTSPLEAAPQSESHPSITLLPPRVTPCSKSSGDLQKGLTSIIGFGDTAGWADVPCRSRFGRLLLCYPSALLHQCKLFFCQALCVQSLLGPFLVQFL